MTVRECFTEFHYEKIDTRGSSAIHLLLTPGYAIASAIDAVSGVEIACGALFTGGQYRSWVERAEKDLDSITPLVADSYFHLICLVSSSKASVPKDTKLTTEWIAAPLGKKAARFAQKKNIFKRHILSRATYLLTALVSLVTLAIDGVIGVIAALFSLITLGRFSSLNGVAYQGLLFPRALKEVFIRLIQAINPRALSNND